MNIVMHKINKSAPDEICHECSQCYEDECRAYSVPHTEEEREQRLQSGCECDDQHTRAIKIENHSEKYRTEGYKPKKEHREK